MLEDFWIDLRYAARGLRRRPAFTALVVATLAIGIAGNVAIFTLVDTVLLRSLRVPNPEELVLFSDGRALGRAAQEALTDKDDAGKVVLYSYPLYERLRDGLPGMRLAAQDSALVASIVRRYGSERHSDENSAEGRCVTANFFDVLGIEAYRGRLFGPEDERAPAANPSLVLSHAYWQRQLGGDPQIVGMKLSVNAIQYTVVGITPPGFMGATVGGATDFWVPMSMAAAFTRTGSPLSEPRYWWLHLLGRLGQALRWPVPKPRPTSSCVRPISTSLRKRPWPSRSASSSCRAQPAFRGCAATSASRC